MSKRILIIKTSSLGDVIHTLPAITEAKKHHPDIQFDWVVEEPFQEIPKLHPSVDRVIPVAIRRWRKSWFKHFKNKEVQSFIKSLRLEKYDLVIDAQGLFKSALISRFAKGKVVGLDRHSAREGWVSRIFYNKSYHVKKGQHAIIRVKQLFAKCLDYVSDDNAIEYGLSYRWDKEKASSRICFLHATTWQSKHWPEIYWRTLAELSGKAGYQVVLPWGNEKEKERADRIANGLDHVEVLPKMTITELAEYFSTLAGVVSVDTGLAHLSAAIEVPTVSVYGSTNPNLTSTKGVNQVHLGADYACAPCLKRQCQFDQKEHNVYPPCYQTVDPDKVWGNLKKLALL
ncbi:lipopolysaccharide heptosyltransferase I [Thiotrichales bacterium 19S9-12]|nr:lipopolysaccharide heptosyltransferase I [Thiotrichales bacterium 19S9-11]MCF6811777.1 lipopolysaccharide heptosyltransferase I [Thiotrichales bacterium 19S9-12]